MGVHPCSSETGAVDLWPWSVVAAGLQLALEGVGKPSTYAGPDERYLGRTRRRGRVAWITSASLLKQLPTVGRSHFEPLPRRPMHRTRDRVPGAASAPPAFGPDCSTFHNDVVLRLLFLLVAPPVCDGSPRCEHGQ